MVNRIRHYRQSMGMTLQGLAEAAGSTKAYIWQIEQKENPQPSVQLGIRLAKALGISVEHLFREDKEPSDG